MRDETITYSDGTTFTPSGPDYMAEYRKRFGHGVPLVAARDPKLESKLKSALAANAPIKAFAEYPHKMQGDYLVDKGS